MPDLRSGAVGAVEQIPLHHNAAAYPGAQGDEDHVAAAFAAAFPVFSQSGYVGIVACFHREAGEPGQSLGDVEHPPAQIDALVDHALGVHRTGNADAQAQNIRVGNAVLTQVALDGGGNVRQDLSAAVGSVGGNFPLVQHGAGLVKIGDFHSGSAQVNAKPIFHRETLLKLM